MTRLFYGSTVLAGLCAMTLIVGCGGSSGSKVPTCDGGACVDAKRDAGAKLDGPPAKLDGVVRLDTQAPNTDGPAANLDGLATNPDGPATTTDGPATTTDGPATTTDGPATDGPVTTTDGPRPDTTIGNQDVRQDVVTPGDTPRDTVAAGDVRTDSQPINPDASADGTTVGDAKADGGPDGIIVTTDAHADIVPDVTPIVPDAHADIVPDVTPIVPDAPADISHDVTVVLLDAAVDSSPDAPADTAHDGIIVTTDATPDVTDAPADAPQVLDGGASDGGVCNGDAGCHAYSFQGDNPDAGLGPTGFTALSGLWTLVVDSGNTVLEGFAASGADGFADVGSLTWTNQTIQVTLRFVTLLGGAGDRLVRICGRANATADTAYCLYVTTDGGSNTGAASIVRLGTGSGSISATPPATSLNIALNAWHTYTLSIGGDSTTVDIAAYMDSSTTAMVSATDISGGRIAQGKVALGVHGATADFDNVTVIAP